MSYDKYHSFYFFYPKFRNIVKNWCRIFELSMLHKSQPIFFFFSSLHFVFWIDFFYQKSIVCRSRFWPFYDFNWTSYRGQKYTTSSRYIILEGSEELQSMAPPAAIGLRGITVFGSQNKDHESETVPTLL